MGAPFGRPEGPLCPFLEFPEAGDERRTSGACHRLIAVIRALFSTPSVDQLVEAQPDANFEFLRYLLDPRKKENACHLQLSLRATNGLGAFNCETA